MQTSLDDETKAKVNSVLHDLTHAKGISQQLGKLFLVVAFNGAPCGFVMQIYPGIKVYGRWHQPSGFVSKGQR